MKKKLLQIVAAAALAISGYGVSGAVSVNDYPAGAAANGITASRHNLGAFGRVIHTNDTTEICVFCHTPHHSNTSLPPAPLWNRVNSASYTAYGTTLGGTSITSVGSVSLACLSCHDGVTTFDTLINAPGKDGVNPAGLDQGWAFGMPIVNEFVPMTPVFHRFNTDPFTCSLCHWINNPAVRLSLGTNLSNDHPVSVAYDSTVATLRPASTVISSIDLTTGLAPSASTALGGNLSQNRWAVKGYISSAARIEDLLKNGKVECSSCHDPHFRNLSWDETENSWTGFRATYCGDIGENCTDGNFLRRVGGNTGSAVCRTCHNK